MKRTRLVIALAVMGLLGAAGTRVGALPQNGYHKDFFDDSGYWVGEDNLFCDGGRFTDGQQTENSSGYTEACSASGEETGNKECFIIMHNNTILTWNCS